MPTLAPRTSEELVAQLLHDLRQPLGNIGLSGFYLGMLLPDAEAKVQSQLQAIEQQVERASRMLSEAAVELGRLNSQHSGGESLELTKRATSAVT